METIKRKSNGYMIGTILITYLIVKIIYRLTGFYYDMSDGILNLNFLIDIALWGFVYFTVHFFLSKLFSLRTK